MKGRFDQTYNRYGCTRVKENNFRKHLAYIKHFWGICLVYAHDNEIGLHKNV
jgi:hypothetical protein